MISEGGVLEYGCLNLSIEYCMKVGECLWEIMILFVFVWMISWWGCNFVFFFLSIKIIYIMGYIFGVINS